MTNRRTRCLTIWIPVLVVLLAGYCAYEQSSMQPTVVADSVWKGRVSKGVFCMALSRTGRQLAVADGCGHVAFIAPASGEIRHLVNSNPLPLYSAEFSPDLKYLAACHLSPSGGTGFKLRDLQTGGLATVVPAMKSATEAHFSPDGKYLAASSCSDIHVWNIEQGNTAKTIRSPGSMRRLVYSPDGRLLAGQDDYGTIRAWDTRSWVEQYAIGHRQRGGYRGALLGWGPDARSLVCLTGFESRKVVIWDPTGKDPDRKVEIGRRLPAIVAPTAASSDGRLLACGAFYSFENRVRASAWIWDLQTDERVSLAQEECKDLGVSVAFSPDGKMLAAGFSNGMVYVWRISYPPKKPSLLDSLKGIVSHPKKSPPTPAKSK